MGQGPLSGVKIVEFAGIGPGPFCGMLLSDLGADVIRIDRKGGGRGSKFDVTSRGRRSVALDLKTPEAVEPLGERTGESIVAGDDQNARSDRQGPPSRLDAGAPFPGLRQLD